MDFYSLPGKIAAGMQTLAHKISEVGAAAGEKMNKPEVSIPTATAAGSAGMLTTDMLVKALTLCVLLMQLIIALPKFRAAVVDEWGKLSGALGRAWRAFFKGEDGKARITAVLLAAAIAIASPFIAGWEGTKNTGYLDVANVPTVCNGHTETAVVGQVKTDAECTALLQQDLTKAFQAVARHVRVPVNEYQLAAYGSFVFNVGEGAFAKSAALRLLNSGHPAESCHALTTQDYSAGVCRGYGCGWAGGKQYKGLQNRRAAERDLCLRGIDAPAARPPAAIPSAVRPWWKFWG